jgi:predicted RNA-binding protein
MTSQRRTPPGPRTIASTFSPSSLDHAIHDGAIARVVFIRTRVAARVHQDDGHGKLACSLPSFREVGRRRDEDVVRIVRTREGVHVVDAVGAGEDGRARDVRAEGVHADEHGPPASDVLERRARIPR